MSNPWGVKLRKTGLNEQRSSEEQMRMADLEQSQSLLRDLASENTSKMIKSHLIDRLLEVDRGQ